MVKKIFLGGLLVCLVALVLVFYFLNSSAPSFSLSVDACENVDRSAYGISSLVFADLPSPPACFFSVVRKFHARSFGDDSFFSEDYFLQPEFYPTFVEQGLPIWQNPDASRYGVVGFGAFPAEQTFSIARGQSSVFHLFVHSGFGVRSVQGMRLVSDFKNLSQGVHVTLDDESASGFVLGETFPTFNREWTHLVRVTVSADANAPSHVAEVVVNTAPPSAEYQSEWERENAPYVPSTQYVGSQTLARVFVKVVD